MAVVVPAVVSVLDFTASIVPVFSLCSNGIDGWCSVSIACVALTHLYRLVLVFYCVCTRRCREHYNGDEEVYLWICTLTWVALPGPWIIGFGASELIDVLVNYHDCYCLATTRSRLAYRF